MDPLGIGTNIVSFWFSEFDALLPQVRPQTLVPWPPWVASLLRSIRKWPAGWHRKSGANGRSWSGCGWADFSWFLHGKLPYRSSGKYVNICSYPNHKLFWVCKNMGVYIYKYIGSNTLMVLSMVKVDIQIFNSLMIMEGMGPKWFTMNKWMVSDPKTYPKILNFSCYVPSRWCRFV